MNGYHQETPRYSQTNYKIKIQPVNVLKEPCIEQQKILISRLKTQLTEDSNNSSCAIINLPLPNPIPTVVALTVVSDNQDQGKSARKNSHEKANHLFRSMFPNVRNVLKIFRTNMRTTHEGRKLCYFRNNILTPQIMKRIFKNNGIKENYYVSPNESIDEIESSFWTFYYGKTIKKHNYITLRDYQSVNHFPSSEALGRKDYLCRNIRRMKSLYPEFYANIMPETFLLQKETNRFRHFWLKTPMDMWIYKPSASARGIGIKLIDSIDQIPKKGGIIQRYIDDPYLINDSKFDLRIYVTVISIRPLVIYMYNDGLVRFASEQYNSSQNSFSNAFIHLTNYSINKNNPEYLIANGEDDEESLAHKWSLEALWKWFIKRKMDPEQVRNNLKSIVIKTILSVYEEIMTATMENCTNPLIPSELYGFDILLDSQLKAWLLEVNLSPSMNVNSKLDLRIKEGILCDYLNLIGVQFPSPERLGQTTRKMIELTEDEIEHDGNRSISGKLLISRYDWSKAEKYQTALVDIYSPIYEKFKEHQSSEARQARLDCLFNKIFDSLTPSDVRILVYFIDQVERRGNFDLIFPVNDRELMDDYLFISHRSKVSYETILCSAYILSTAEEQEIIKGKLKDLCSKGVHKTNDLDRDCNWQRRK